MKIKAILKKYWVYFEEDILHSSKALLPGIVFHNLETGTLSRYVIKYLSVSREHRYLPRRGVGIGVAVPCKINHGIYLFISGKVLEGFW